MPDNFRWDESLPTHRAARSRSGLADGSDSGNPVWSTDAAQNYGALIGVFESVQGQPGKFPPLSERSTPSTFTNLAGLDLTERGRTHFSKTYGSDVKLPRHNNAEIED